MAGRATGVRRRLLELRKTQELGGGSGHHLKMAANIRASLQSTKRGALLVPALAFDRRKDLVDFVNALLGGGDLFVQ